MNQDAREPGHAEGLALGRICHGRGACEQDACEPGHAEKDSHWAGYAMDVEHASRMHVNPDTRRRTRVGQDMPWTWSMRAGCT